LCLFCAHFLLCLLLNPDVLCSFLALLTLKSWRWKCYIPLKCLVTFSRLHGVVSKAKELSITTAVLTSNPTEWIQILISTTNRLNPDFESK
jgi:hypothetical protein